VEFHPALAEYTLCYPNKDMGEDEEMLLRLAAYPRWRVAHTLFNARLADNPVSSVHPVQPLYVWRSRTEPVFELDTVPHWQLQSGDTVEMFGMWDGRWRLTDQVKRRHEFRLITKDPPVEWVYILCENDLLRQQAWLKIPARFFYPTTLGIELRKGAHAIGSLFARPRPIFPHHARSRRLSEKLRFRRGKHTEED